MIMEVINSDYKNKCGNCKYFDTVNHIDGYCVCTENKIKSYNRYRYYNSKACVYKERGDYLDVKSSN